jgi:hypothetical protein
MTASDDFNANGYRTEKINGFVLGVQYGCGNGNTTYMTYDFMARVMIARTGSSDGGTVVKPFAELDRDALISLRDRLIALDGKPPELPPEAPATAAMPKKLNL